MELVTRNQAQYGWWERFGKYSVFMWTSFPILTIFMDCSNKTIIAIIATILNCLAFSVIVVSIIYILFADKNIDYSKKDVWMCFGILGILACLFIFMKIVL